MDTQYDKNCKNYEKSVYGKNFKTEKKFCVQSLLMINEWISGNETKQMSYNKQEGKDW